jgi:hypothetical protein
MVDPDCRRKRQSIGSRRLHFRGMLAQTLSFIVLGDVFLATSLEHGAVFSSADVSGAGCPSALVLPALCPARISASSSLLAATTRNLPFGKIPSICLTGAAGEHPWWMSTNVPGSRSDDVVMADGQMTNPAGGPSANGSPQRRMACLGNLSEMEPRDLPLTTMRGC